MKRNEKPSIPTLDKTASFMAVSVPLLWLSYMMAAKIHAASHLIPHGILLASCFVLLESLVLKCALFLTGSKDSGNALCKTPQGSASKTLPAGETSLPEEERHLMVYAQSAAESQLSTETYRQKLKDAVHEYIYWAMAPILEQEEMHALWLEYESWIDSPHYRPIPRDWKWKKGKDVRHIDVRHLTWNIAKRRGMGTDKDCGYNTVVCARFIKELFPGLCRNVKDTTLSQCLNADPNEGYIKIDVPDRDNPAVFHYNQP